MSRSPSPSSRRRFLRGGVAGVATVAIAYRTQKALRAAPPHYPEYEPGNRTRTPVEVLRHMTSLMGYATTHFLGGSYPLRPEPLATWDAEVARFHDTLEALAEVVRSGAEPPELSTEQLVQGPIADALTHVGQLAMLRRLTESPVAPENFIHADVRADRLGVDQPLPNRPDAEWPERPR